MPPSTRARLLRPSWRGRSLPRCHVWLQRFPARSATRLDRRVGTAYGSPLYGISDRLPKHPFARRLRDFPMRSRAAPNLSSSLMSYQRLFRLKAFTTSHRGRSRATRAVGRRVGRLSTVRAFFMSGRIQEHGEAMLNGLMMDDFQLTLTVLVERAERLNSASPVVSRRPGGSVRRTTLGDCARTAPRHPRRRSRGDAALESDRASGALLRGSAHGRSDPYSQPASEPRGSELYRRRRRGSDHRRGRVSRPGARLNRLRLRAGDRCLRLRRFAGWSHRV